MGGYRLVDFTYFVYLFQVRIMKEPSYLLTVARAGSGTSFWTRNGLRTPS